MNTNYEEREDGVYKKDASSTKGNAGYFSKPVPPVRSGNVPLKNGHVDMKQWEKELEEKNACTNK